jgi:hypothetical protein
MDWNALTLPRGEADQSPWDVFRRGLATEDPIEAGQPRKYGPTGPFSRGMNRQEVPGRDGVEQDDGAPEGACRGPRGQVATRSSGELDRP